MNAPEHTHGHFDCALPELFSAQKFNRLPDLLLAANEWEVTAHGDLHTMFDPQQPDPCRQTILGRPGCSVGDFDGAVLPVQMERRIYKLEQEGVPGAQATPLLPRPLVRGSLLRSTPTNDLPEMHSPVSPKPVTDPSKQPKEDQNKSDERKQIEPSEQDAPKI